MQNVPRYHPAYPSRTRGSCACHSFDWSAAMEEFCYCTDINFISVCTLIEMSLKFSSFQIFLFDSMSSETQYLGNSVQYYNADMITLILHDF